MYIHGLDPGVLEENKISLCVRCRESYEKQDVSASDYAYGPPDFKHPIDPSSWVSPYDSPAFIITHGYNTPFEAMNLQQRLKNNNEEAIRSCNTGSGGVAVQRALSSFL